MAILYFILSAAAPSQPVATMAPPPPLPPPIVRVSPPPTTEPPRGYVYDLPIKPGPWPSNPNQDPKPAYPMINPGNWAGPEDYPRDLLDEGVQGITGFRVYVDRLGQVSRCEITQSSGTRELDELTCQLVSQRARFEPATNLQGRPVEGKYENRIRWIAPEVVPLPEPFTVVRSVTVEIDGSVSSCRIDKVEGAATALLTVGQDKCPPGAFAGPFLDSQGRPARKVVRLTESVVIADPPPDAAKQN